MANGLFIKSRILLSSNKNMTTTIVKAGYLKKMGEINKQMRKRYFALQDDQLYYYKNDSSEKPINSILIADATVEKLYGTQTDFTLSSPYFCRVYHMRAETQEIRDEWFDVIAKQISKYEVVVSQPENLQLNFHVVFSPETGYTVFFFTNFWETIFI